MSGSPRDASDGAEGGEVACGPALTTSLVARRWAPLAASWVLMTAELVIVLAVIARLPQPELQLAAWGVVFAIATVIQAPATALLPVSTALALDRVAYARLRRFTLVVLVGLSGLHALVLLPSVYDALLLRVMGLPPEVADAARWALVLMLPWSFGTGYRRFVQGAIIRAGFSGVVSWGAAVRLAVNLSLLGAGAALTTLPGAQLAAGAIIAGVLAEMAFVRWRAATLLPRHMPLGGATASRLSLRRFAAVFAPLVVTTLLTMLVQTLVTAVLGRMPRALESLAVWPVVFGFLIVWQSPALAYTEVVISLARQRGATVVLRRFTWRLAAVLSVGLALATATPLARAWYAGVMGLPERLLDLAVLATLLAVLAPGVRVLNSAYQGVLVANERPGGILEAVVVFLVVVALVLALGVAWGGAAGALVGAVALVVGLAAQTLWLAWRAAPLLAVRTPSGAPTA